MTRLGDYVDDDDEQSMTDLGHVESIREMYDTKNLPSIMGRYNDAVNN